MNLQHYSGKDHPQHIPRLLPLSSAAFRGLFKNSFTDAMGSFQDAFISKILLYRLGSSFSPMRYHRNRMGKGAENLSVKKDNYTIKSS